MKSEPLLGIQYLRGIAALMVVFHHARNPIQGYYNPMAEYDAFAWGVDIFFVISGFIMYVSARQESPLEFLRRRAIRVVPLYWAATLVLLVLNLRSGRFSPGNEQWGHVLQSLAFIPHYSLTRVTEIWPYLVPGWTLNYEVFFYLVFCVGLTARKLVTTLNVVLLGLVAAGFWFAPEGAVLKSYTSLLLLEFLIGTWIGVLYERRKTRSLFWLVPIGFAGLFLTPLLEGATVQQLSRIAASSVIVLGVVFTAPKRAAFFELLGNASYSLYLTHTIAVFAGARFLVSRLHLEGGVQFAVLVSVSMVLATAVGILVHLFIEKPVLAFLRTKTKPRAKPPTPTPAASD